MPDNILTTTLIFSLLLVDLTNCIFFRFSLAHLPSFVIGASQKVVPHLTVNKDNNDK